MKTKKASKSGMVMEFHVSFRGALDTERLRKFAKWLVPVATIIVRWLWSHHGGLVPS